MAINIQELVTRLQLEAIQTRINETEDAHDIARGVYDPPDDHLLPAPLNQTRQRAWDRMKRQQQTLGPRIMATKVNAILGDINWGGDSDQLDDDLTNLDLRSLARRLLEPLIITGITAGMAHTLPDTGETIISRLGGYLEPYMHPDDMDRVVGLYQVQSGLKINDSSASDFNDFAGREQRAKGGLKYHVRIYDWSDGEDHAVIREWRDLRNPTHLGRAPDNVIENAPVPRFRIRDTTHDGLVLGEILVAAPQLKALWATEARMTLTEENSAFPMLLTLGDVDSEVRIGPGEVLTMMSDGDARWMDPGSLEELRLQRQLRLERIREDLALPGGFLGNDSPSGEALSQSNIRFRQNSQSYADDVADLITELVEDYATLQNLEPAQVSISISKEYDEEKRVQSIMALYAANLIPLRVAATELQPFFGSWSDEDLNDFIETQTATVSVDDFNNLMSGPTQARGPTGPTPQE